MIKLIAIDMDGTLLDSQDRISEANCQAVKEALASGIKVVICTGRPRTGVASYLSDLGLTGEETYLIVNNGVEIYRGHNWDLVRQDGIDRKDLDYFAHLIADFPEVRMVLTEADRYVQIGLPISPVVAWDANWVSAPLVSQTLEEARASDKPLLKVMYMAEDAAMTAFYQTGPADLFDRYSAVHSQSHLIEVMAKGVTKAHALTVLAQQFQITPDQIMAIGDGDNDLEMLAYAGCSVAMANGTLSVLETARYQTASHDDDGVAKAIREFALGEFGG